MLLDYLQLKSLGFFPGQHDRTRITIPDTNPKSIGNILFTRASERFHSCHNRFNFHSNVKFTEKSQLTLYYIHYCFAFFILVTFYTFQNYCLLHPWTERVTWQMVYYKLYILISLWRYWKWIIHLYPSILSHYKLIPSFFPGRSSSTPLFTLVIHWAVRLFQYQM